MHFSVKSYLLTYLTMYVVLNIIFCCNHQFDRTMVRNFKTDYLNDVVIFLQFFGSGKINDFKILDFLEKLKLMSTVTYKQHEFSFSKKFVFCLIIDALRKLALIVVCTTYIFIVFVVILVFKLIWYVQVYNFKKKNHI